MCDRCIQYSAQNPLKGPPFLSKDSTLKNQKTKKPKTTMKSHFGFFWVFRF